MKIPELRASGMGYKAIAYVLGLSRDTVRGFLQKVWSKRKCRGYAEKTWNSKLKTECCALTVQSLLNPKHHGRKRKFCCDECRREWWKQNADKINRSHDAMYQCECSYCHKQFISYGNKHRKYCSHECYIKDRFGGTENGI